MLRGQAKFQQKKLSARRRVRALRLGGIAAAAAGVLFFGLALISQIGALQIKEVAVEGNSRVSKEELVGAVDAAISGNYLGVFSRSNALLYPKEAALAAVAALPAVESAKVSRDGIGVVKVSVVERAPSARLCKGTAGDYSDCYLLDEQGVAFRKADADAAGYVYRGEAEADPIGRPWLPASDFKKLQFFMGRIDGLSLTPREADLGDGGYATVLLGGGGKLLVNLDDDLSVVLANLAAIISDKSIAPDFPDFLARLDYIKLDSGNKIVYKLRN